MNIPVIAMLDTGATPALTVSKKLAIQAQKSLGALVIKLKHPRKLSGFLGKEDCIVTMKLRIDFEIDGP